MTEYDIFSTRTVPQSSRAAVSITVDHRMSLLFKLACNELKKLFLTLFDEFRQFCDTKTKVDLGVALEMNINYLVEC